MSAGPGLLSGRHYDRANGGATLLYSDDHPRRAVFGSRATTAGTASGAAPDADTEADTVRRRVDYQAYRHFERLPDDAPEKKRFREWQNWQQYRQWERLQR